MATNTIIAGVLINPPSSGFVQNNTDRVINKLSLGKWPCLIGSGRMSTIRPVHAAPEKISEKVEESIKNAQETCADDPASGECVAAWDEVEELSAAASHARDKKKGSDPLEDYCKDNPETRFMDYSMDNFLSQMDWDSQQRTGLLSSEEYHASNEEHVDTNDFISEFDNQDRFDRHDHTAQYTTDEVFPTREDLLTWAKGVGLKNGSVINIFRSENATPKKGTRTKLLIGCEKSGSHRPWKNTNPIRNSGTKKCNCPFRLKGKALGGCDGWTLHVICGIHNHELYDDLRGHPYIGRLTPKEKTIVEDMTRGLVRPKKILGTLLGHNEHNVTSMKQVYNYRQTVRKTSRSDRTEMQHLLMLMERDNYVYRVNRLDDSNIINDIFWAHPDSITLANTFHYVLVIDSTYKTCRHGFPMLEIVGMTPVVKTFSIAFTYLHSEKTENYTWMTLPEMGPVIASRYSVGLVSLSLGMSLTFFPQRGIPPARQTLIVVCFVNQCHWVQVYLKPDSPIPTPAHMWKKYCYREALAWEEPYLDRIQHWHTFCPPPDPSFYDLV